MWWEVVNARGSRPHEGGFTKKANNEPQFEPMQGILVPFFLISKQSLHVHKPRQNWKKRRVERRKIGQIQNAYLEPKTHFRSGQPPL